MSWTGRMISYNHVARHHASIAEGVRGRRHELRGCGRGRAGRSRAEGRGAAARAHEGADRARRAPVRAGRQALAPPVPARRADPRTGADGIRLVGELGALLEVGERARELEAELQARYDRVRAAIGGRRPRRVFCPIWRKPYMTINRDTYVHDMLAVVGGANVFRDETTRYPQIT